MHESTFYIMSFCAAFLHSVRAGARVEVQFYMVYRCLQVFQWDDVISSVSVSEIAPGEHPMTKLYQTGRVTVWM